MSPVAIFFLTVIAIFFLIWLFWFISTASARKAIKIKKNAQHALFVQQMRAEQVKAEAKAAEKATRSAIDNLANHTTK